MRLDHAIKVVKNLQRYRYRNCVKRHPRGAFLRNIIPRTRITLRSITDEVQAQDMGQWVWVNIDDLKSTQNCLAVQRLLKQLRLYPKNKCPVVVQIAPRKYVIWDGNHRVVSAMLLGKHRVHCLLIARLRKVVK